MPTLNLIAAMTPEGVIGDTGCRVLPWNLPGDLKHFREATAGCTVIMGRKTWDSLPKHRRPLPNRYNVVVTSHPQDLPGADAVRDPSEALQVAYEAKLPTWVIGGAQLYKAMLPLCEGATITWVPSVTEFKGEPVFFPMRELGLHLKPTTLTPHPYCDRCNGLQYWVRA